MTQAAMSTKWINRPALFLLFLLGEKNSQKAPEYTDPTIFLRSSRALALIAGRHSDLLKIRLRKERRLIRCEQLRHSLHH